MAYEKLEASAVLEIAQRLQARIEARFPDRNKGRVAERLVAVASDVERAAARSLPIRILLVSGQVVIGLLVSGSIISLVAVLIELVRTSGSALAWLPAVETIISDVVYVGIAVIFLWLLPGHVVVA